MLTYKLKAYLDLAVLLSSVQRGSTCNRRENMNMNYKQTGHFACEEV